MLFTSWMVVPLLAYSLEEGRLPTSWLQTEKLAEKQKLTYSG
jgi:hypothetical protein